MVGENVTHVRNMRFYGEFRICSVLMSCL